MKRTGHRDAARGVRLAEPRTAQSRAGARGAQGESSRSWRRILTGSAVTLLLAAITAALAAYPDLAARLELDRAALAAGELWRLFTGHLVHFSHAHLAPDLFALVVLGSACELRAPRRLRALLPVAALAISAAVLLFAPEIGRYRGLSGLDSALFAFLVVELLRAPEPPNRRARRRALDRALPVAAALLFGAKLVLELRGVSLFVDGGAEFEGVPVAHLAGALTGSVAGLLRRAAPSQEEAERAVPGQSGLLELGE